mmetsp:Transcript_13110/g.31274  ORF Transcript_13110/g.31274 Transcript_13110/m.31274 type:complete len:401 (-) Transcript_13110:195-1397(-)
MLLYYNKSCFWILLQLHGSVFYRWDTLLGSLIVAMLGGVVQYLRDAGWEYAPSVMHHYGFQALGAGVTFAIVFRTQLAWNRYWEACTQLHIMYSKWTDTFAQFQAFASVSDEAAMEKGDKRKAAFLRQKQKRVQTNFALLSMVVADRLHMGDNQEMEEARARWATTRANLRVCKDSQLFNLPDMILKKDFDRKHAQEGVYVVLQRPSREQVELLEQSNDPVSTVMYWIVWDLADVMRFLDVAPPIQSRMYQELSNGMLGYNNCLKIADVPFPLPFAQLLGLLLASFSVFIPIYVVVFTGSPVAGPILSFFLHASLWCLNEVAKELENPFGEDINDISLVDFHGDFVDMLEDVCKPKQEAMLRNPSMGIEGLDPRLVDPEVTASEVTSTHASCVEVLQEAL